MRDPNPSVANEHREETRQQQRGALEIEETQMNNNEEKSVSTSRSRGTKNSRVELQGEFKKIKPPLFDSEAEDVVDSWLINMNLYF